MENMTVGKFLEYIATLKQKALIDDNTVIRVAAADDQDYDRTANFTIMKDQGNAIMLLDVNDTNFKWKKLI